MASPLVLTGPQLDRVADGDPGIANTLQRLIAIVRALVSPAVVLTPAVGAVVLDLSPSLALDRTCTTAADLSVTTNNRSSGLGASLRIVNSGGGVINLSWPSWVVVGSALPATLAAGKTLMVSVRAYGTAEADVVAACAVQA